MNLDSSIPVFGPLLYLDPRQVVERVQRQQVDQSRRVELVEQLPCCEACQSSWPETKIQSQKII